MTDQQFSDLILAHAGAIERAIGTYGPWQVWLQVEMVFMLETSLIFTTREVAYPAPNNNLFLDLLLHHSETEETYAVEVVVESALNEGSEIYNTMSHDAIKIRNYTSPVHRRWVVAVCYSDAARNALRINATNPANTAIYHERIMGIRTIGCFIKTV